jgi:hypothetical protein
MSKVAARATRWDCARCGVSAGRIDGRRATLPTGWTELGNRSFCLSCSRALAGDAAMDCAPVDSSREELVRIRRGALIEFEIRRSPEAPNRAIAQACRTSPGAVAAVRERLPAALHPPLGARGGG